ncbi:MAG: hypothetical protein H6712_19080 [Myxococcales bacterium]|nr:hypothetical protein [Myxococcales bacterium]MCB9715979.1 hypothetical protein [Myxococcales bacterium]
MPRRPVDPCVVSAAAMLLLALGCRDRDAPMGETESATDGSEGASDSEPGSDTGATACVAGETRPCYEGPPGTQGLGICRAGEQSCAADGSGWLACEEQVQPEPAELCQTPQDDDCDGTPSCEPVVSWWQQFPASALQAVIDAEGHLVIAGVAGFGELQGVELEGFFLLELDETGELLWHRPVGDGSSMSFAGLMVDDDGSITIAGYYEGEPDFGGGPLPPGGFATAYMARYDGDGEHRWSRSEDFSSITGLTRDRDGTLVVVGRDEDFDPEGYYERLIVAGHDPEQGLPQWTLEGTGIGGLFDAGMSIVATEAGELVVAAVMGPDGSTAPTIAGTPIELLEYGPLLLRLDRVSGLLGQRAPYEEAPQGLSNPRLFTRPGGTLELVSNAYGGGLGQTIILSRYDAGLEPLGEVRLGDDAWASGAAPSPDGTTVLGVAFSGELELGPIGVGLPTFGPGLAIAAVDEHGNGRWVEPLYQDSFLELGTLAVGADGQVAVMATVSGAATLAGELVYGSFLAVLHP